MGSFKDRGSDWIGSQIFWERTGPDRSLKFWIAPIPISHKIDKFEKISGKATTEF